MANFREHVTVSGLLGLGYGLGATVALGFAPVQGLLAGCLTAVGGMLPDLDSPRARPVQELFGVVAAVAPLLLVNRVIRFLELSSDPETVMAVIVCMYPAIKYGAAFFINAVSVHRGMFHSLPAMLIAGELVYLAHPNPAITAKLLMAGGVCTGFLSHLLLDELYSVQMKDSRLTLKRSSGTALKISGDKLFPNVMTFTLLATLTYAALDESSFFDQRNLATDALDSSLPSDLPRTSEESSETSRPAIPAPPPDLGPSVPLGPAVPDVASQPVYFPR